MSERDVAAEAVMALVQRGLLPATPEAIRQVADTTRIPVTCLRDAWRRIQIRGYQPPGAPLRHRTANRPK